MHAAAQNAAKTGVKTSEFWVSVGAAAAGVLCALLVPTPFGMIAAAGVGAAAAVYSTSRGNVKAAALGAVGAAAAAASSAGGIVGEVGTAVGVVAGAATK
jgi:hypothetical protein